MRHAVGLLSLLVLLAAVARAQEPATQPAKADAVKLEPAEWAPADVLVYVGVTDMQATWEDFKKTSGFAALDKSGESPLPSAQMFGDAIEGVRKQLAQMLDIEPEQLKNPFGGALAFFLEAPSGGKPDDVHMALVASVTDAALAKQYYDSALAKLKAQGKYESVSAGEYTIDVVTSASSSGSGAADAAEDDVPEMTSPEEVVTQALGEMFDPDKLPENLALTIAGDRLVVAESVDQVRAILKREKGSQTLAGSDDYKAMGRKFKPIGPVRMLVNVPRLLDLARSEASESEAQSLKDWVKLLGADSLGSLLAHWRMHAGPAESKFEAFLLMRGERSGLAKILSMENAPTAPPATMSADTVMGLVLNAQASEILDEVERMLRQTDPQQADAFRSGLQVPLPDGQTFDFRKSFIDHLRAPLTLSLAIGRPLSPQSINLLLSIKHDDEAALVRALSGPVLGGMQGREVRGRQVFDAPAMPPFLAPGMIAAASTSDRLLIGNSSAVESALEPGNQPPLAETEQWRKLARVLPEQCWLLFYMDERRWLESVAEASAKQDELMGGGPNLGTMILMMASRTREMVLGPEEMRKGLKYKSQGAFTISTRPDGLLITGVQLKPEP